MSAPPSAVRWRSVLLAFLVLSGVYGAVAVETPLTVGLWQDDATYVATARSLAEGQGYRLSQFPNAPLQTHYPPLYSLLLSLGFRVSPDYPSNLAWLLWPGVCGAAWLVILTSLYWRRVFDPPPWLWLAGTFLSALSPVLVGFVRYTMSDLVYGGLVAAALLCLDWPSSESVKPSGRVRRLTLLGAVFVGLAMTTRSIGISAFVGVLLWLSWRRRWRDALGFFGVVIAFVLPWSIWQSWASESNGADQHAFLMASELSYGIWAPESLEQSLRVIVQNGFRTLHDVAYYQLALPMGFANDAMVEPGWKTVALFGICSLTLLLCIIGFVSSLRGGIRALHAYALVYAGLVIAWPFEPHRFFIPWAPAILHWWLTGVAVSASGIAKIARRLAPHGEGLPRDWPKLATLVATGVIALLFIVEDVQILSSRSDRYFMREMPQGLDVQEIEEVYAFVRERIPEDAVIAASWSGGLHLNTGRRGYFVWPDTDPYARYYGVDREAWRFYGVRSQSELMSIHTEMATQLVDAYGHGGIEYYLDQPHWLEARVMQVVIESNPALFEKLFESSKGTYRLYRLKFPAPAKKAT